jgi:hypothetical protein
MNEKIKELIKQAGAVEIKVPDKLHIPEALFGSNIERFAELIIEECAKLAEYQGYNQMFGQGGLRTKLHEYFGIENER